MCYSGSKCWRIRALAKASCKRLKADLTLGVRKLGSDSVAPKLGEFPLFDEFFPDLANFWDLHVFWPLDFLDFLVCSIPPLPNSSTSLLPFFFHEAGLLPSCLLRADLLDNPVIFNIEVSGTAILLKLWMNCQSKLAKPRKTWILQTDLGSGQSFTASILSASILIPFDNTIYPKKQTSSW